MTSPANQPATERLYNLLPSLYRQRDATQGEPLRALLAVIEAELQAVEEDISGLYRDWFIETCAEWVVPYIGQTLGVRTLHDIQGASGFSLRAYVANTLAYRRRKGTPAVLEQVARDATGWRSRAVEFFQLLSTTQHMNHVRLYSPATLDLHDPNPLELLEGPFQSAAHTVDVRAINFQEGWYNIPNVGMFLYRLQPYQMTGAVPRRVGDGLYYFSSLGHAMPLFHAPEAEDEITHLAEETNVPTPIRRLALHRDLAEYAAENAATAESDRPDNSRYYGPNRGVGVLVNGQFVPPINVVGRNLSSWSLPPAGQVAVDPVNGRLAFAAGEDPGAGAVLVNYAYGFSADLGGGPYDRFSTLTDLDAQPWSMVVAKGTAVDTLQGALAQWQAAGSPSGVIQVADNGVYGGILDIALPAGVSLVIQAAQGVRPDVRPVGNFALAGPEDAALTLNGLLVQGALHLSGDLNVTLRHCTLAPGVRLLEGGLPEFPGRASIQCNHPATDNPLVVVDHCILGPVRLPEEARGLVATDSIIDNAPGPGVNPPAIAGDDAGLVPGPATTLERVTVLGAVLVRQLDLASEVIFTGLAVTVRRQEGCVRFSYLPEGSQTPRRFQCQPDLALAHRAEALGLTGVPALSAAERDLVLARLKPRFTSEHYGHPAYCQLSSLCAAELRAGAEDGSEMGAFRHLQQPQREANLRAALQEYLPFGLNAGLIYVT